MVKLNSDDLQFAKAIRFRENRPKDLYDYQELRDQTYWITTVIESFNCNNAMHAPIQKLSSRNDTQTRGNAWKNASGKENLTRVNCAERLTLRKKMHRAREMQYLIAKRYIIHFDLIRAWWSQLIRVHPRWRVLWVEWFRFAYKVIVSRFQAICFYRFSNVRFFDYACTFYVYRYCRDKKFKKFHISHTWTFVSILILRRVSYVYLYIYIKYCTFEYIYPINNTIRRQLRKPFSAKALGILQRSLNEFCRESLPSGRWNNKR